MLRPTLMMASGRVARMIGHPPGMAAAGRSRCGRGVDARSIDFRRDTAFAPGFLVGRIFLYGILVEALGVVFIGNADTPRENIVSALVRASLA